MAKPSWHTVIHFGDEALSFTLQEVGPRINGLVDIKLTATRIGPSGKAVAEERIVQHPIIRTSLEGCALALATFPGFEIRDYHEIQNPSPAERLRADVERANHQR